MFLAGLTKNKAKQELFLCSKQISSLSDKINYSEAPREKISEREKEAIRYINILILSKTYALLQKIKKFTDEIESKELMGGIRTEIRDIEKIIELRNTIIKINDENIMKTISDSNPDIFMNMRNLASIIYRMDEMKKPLLNKSKYYDKIKGSLLYILDDIILKRGPVVDLAELYSDFIKEYPNIELTQSDFQTAIVKMIDEGYLDKLEETSTGFKIVKLKPLKMTETYQNTISYISSQTRYLENGITQEELANQLVLTNDFAGRLLEELENDSISWKHEGKYYFPGLAESAYKMKTVNLEVA